MKSAILLTTLFASTAAFGRWHELASRIGVNRNENGNIDLWCASIFETTVLRVKERLCSLLPVEWSCRILFLKLTNEWILSSFSFLGIVPTNTRLSTTALSVSSLSDDLKTSDTKEIEAIQEKWNAVRHMSPEEAASLEPEWKEAYDRFYEKYNADMGKMEEITDKLQRMIEPPRVEKKTKGQRKRDAYAKVQAREAARAAQK